MKFSLHPFYLEFNHPFALAHGSRNGTPLVFLKLEHEGIIAYGEASLPPYRSETTESVIHWIEKNAIYFEEAMGKNPFENPAFFPFSKDHPAAAAAWQTAVLDFYAQSKNKRLFDFFEKRSSAPSLTLTITKNDFDFIEEKLQLAPHFSHFKLKLTATDDDIDFVKAIRNRTDLPFCIDCNQGYLKKEMAMKLAVQLEKMNCVILEQPLKDKDHDGHYWLKQRCHIPVIADESVCFYEDLVQYHEAYSGVNIKLIKCGGLLNAQKMMELARTKNMLKLVGCMSESSLGVATAAVLASQADMADLDAPYLNKNNPFSGFEIRNCKIEISGDAGIGVRPNRPF